MREILQERGIGPDFRSTSPGEAARLDFIHRPTPDADLYFVCNTTMRPMDAECVFRVCGKAPELWFPDTDEIRRPAVYDSVKGGTKVALHFPPVGSLFVVFRKTASGRIEAAPRKDAAKRPPPWTIRGPWEVRFPPGWGAPRSRVFPELRSWARVEDEGVKYFSGIAAYHKEFEPPGELLAAGREILLDLGRVRVVADVWLNGTHLGILWKPPFQVKVTGALRKGVNRLKIEVANTWSNRLVGDANSPEGKRFCRTNMKHALTWKSPWKTHPLLESGLLGPVRLLDALDARSAGESAKKPRGRTAAWSSSL